MQGNNELVLKNMQPTVKDGAQERFYKKFREIQQGVELRISKEREEKLRSVRLKTRSKYFDAARELARRWFGWGYDDFESVKSEDGELAILDKLLIRKIMKKSLAVGFGAAVLLPMIYIADAALANLSIYFYSLDTGTGFIGLGWLIASGLSWVALIAGNIVLAFMSIGYLQQNLRPALAFLYNRKQALLLHQELEKEA